MENQIKRFSRTGFIIAVVFIILGLSTAVRGVFDEEMVVIGVLGSLIPIGAGLALLLRSFRPPLKWGRGIATWSGGLFAGAALFLLAAGKNFPGLVMFVILSICLLWIGFKRPKIAA